MVGPLLYDLVMWGFAEENCFGQRILRPDIQARLDGYDAAERELNEAEGSPMYVGYRCQACWEAAVTLVTYGQHLCEGTPGQSMKYTANSDREGLGL
jgi:hypothetical protein